MIKYGVFLGKFSKCFHIGHQSIVDKIREDGLEPIILIGSAQYSNTPACPLHVDQRREMISLVNPGIQIYEHSSRCRVGAASGVSESPLT